MKHRPRGVSDFHNVEHVRAAARRRLPSPLFDFIDGGADDETTMRRNQAAFQNLRLLPRCLRDVSAIDTSIELFGKRIDAPLICSASGMLKLFHGDGEVGVARASAAAGAAYMMATLASTALEDIAVDHDGVRLFQIYAIKDRGVTREFLARCRAARVDAVALTVDMPAFGNRERDLVSGMSIPPRLTVQSMASFARRPGWVWRYFTTERPELANFAGRVDWKAHAPTLAQYINTQFDAALDWSEIDWYVREWNGPFYLKGVLSAADAARAADAGVTGVIVSNHGGRQLDGAPASLDVLASVIDVVGDRVEVILDGGVRRGADIIKALALGAKACSTARPFLFGLAAGGERGVARVYQLLKAELARSMALLGVSSISEISSHHLWGGPRRPG